MHQQQQQQQQCEAPTGHHFWCTRTIQHGDSASASACAGIAVVRQHGCPVRRDGTRGRAVRQEQRPRPQRTYVACAMRCRDHTTRRIARAWWRRWVVGVWGWRGNRGGAPHWQSTARARLSLLCTARAADCLSTCGVCGPEYLSHVSVPHWGWWTARSTAVPAPNAWHGLRLVVNCGGGCVLCAVCRVS